MVASPILSLLGEAPACLLPCTGKAVNRTEVFYFIPIGKLSFHLPHLSHRERHEQLRMILGGRSAESSSKKHPRSHWGPNGVCWPWDLTSQTWKESYRAEPHTPRCPYLYLKYILFKMLAFCIALGAHSQGSASEVKSMLQELYCGTLACQNSPNMTFYQMQKHYFHLVSRGCFLTPKYIHQRS